MKKSNIIKKLLTTVSVTSVIIGGTETLATSRYTTDAITNLSIGMKDIGSGRDWWGRWQPAAAPTAFVDGSSLYIYQSSDIIADRNNAVINGLDVNGTKASLTVQENLSLGSVINGSIPVKIEDTKILTLTGQDAKIPGGWFGYGGVNINNNDYSALGEIDFGNKAATLTVQSHNAGNIVFGTNTKAANTSDATLNVKSNLEITDNSFAKIKTISIDDNKSLKFSTGGANNELKLLETAGSAINFGPTGDGKFEINAKSSVGGAWRLLGYAVVPTPTIVIDGSSLGGTLAGDAGIIELNINDNTTFSHKGGDVALIGIDNTHRAKKFTINGNDKNLDVNGKIFAKELEFNKGNLTFNNKVNTGLNGSSKFLDKTTTKFNEDADLGKVDFNDTDSKITIANNKKLKGEFIGHEGHNDINGTIIFEGAGELDGSTSKVKELQATGNGNIILKGKHEISNVILHDNPVTIEDGFELKGDINSTKGTRTILTLAGDAVIDGNIGNTQAVTAINLANFANKALTFKGENIATREITFDANGGILKLTNNTNDVVINSAIFITADTKGIINANGLANDKTLTINGNIGNIAGNQSLGQISLDNGADLEFKGGDVNIDDIKIGNDSVIKLADNKSYRIAKISNNPGEGKVEISKRLTLVEGTNLGSNTSKLKSIKVERPVTVTVGKDVNIYADKIENTAPRHGSFHFTGAGGTNIIDAKIGDIGTEFNNLTIDPGVAAELKQDAYFGGETTLGGANSILTISGNYSANGIKAIVNGNGAIKFNNLNDIKVNLYSQAVNMNSLETITISGKDIEIIVTGRAAYQPLGMQTIDFTNAALASTLTLPTEFKLNGINVDNVGNGNHTIVTSGVLGGRLAFKQTIDAANHIGNDAGNLVNIVLNGDNDTLEVQTAAFYSTVKTGQNGKNEVIFNAVGGTNYGVGENGRKLKKVTFAENTVNLGDIYANDVVINDNKTISFAKFADNTNLQLGHANGIGSKAIFTDLIELKSNITTIKGGKGQVTFNNTATIRNDIGTNIKALEKVEFVGANKDVILSSNIFADEINFGSSNIIVSPANASLNGDTNINGNINLNNSTLTLNGDTEFGANTTITTSLKAWGTLGKIVTNGKITIDSAMRAKAIKIEEDKGVGAGKYLLVDIQGGGSIEFTDGSDRLPRITYDQAYSRWTLETSAVDGKIYAIRENVAGPKAKEDVKAAGGDKASQQNAGLIANNNKVISSIGKIAPEDEISKVRGNAIERTTTTIEGQAAKEQINVTQIVNNAIRTRISDIAFIGTKRNMATIAAGDEENETYGAWAMPFYSQASQKKQKQGLIAGYDAKTSGGIFGIDTMLNDNLSLGTAVSVTNTNMKYNGNKTGDKTQIKGLIFSLYGSQQFADNYFVQAVASLSSNNVHNKEKQIRGNSDNSVVTEIAQGKYRSKSFMGEILLGYNADFADLTLVPVAGVRYTKNNGANYKETGTA